MCVALLTIAGGICHAETGNLVANADFEKATDNPWQPTSWTMTLEGSAQGTLDRINDGFHGQSAARLTNQSARQPSVFIRLYQKIAVERNTDYVISMYVRCKSVGYAWFGGGPNWLVRQPLPQDTAGKWVRVSVSCNSGDSDTWELTILSEDVTEALDIDAVQMEKGKAATDFHGEPFVVMLQNDTYAGVYESPKEVNVSLKVINYEAHKLPVTATWQLRRLPDGKKLLQGEVSLDVASKGSAQARLPFPDDAGYGLYEYLLCTSANDHKIESEARAAIMRAPPQDRRMDNLGFNIHVAQDNYARLLCRLGLRWVRVDWHWYLCEPTRGEVLWWYLDGQVKVAEKYGLKLFPIFGAGSAPAWAQLKDDTFNPQEHADYVRRVLERYQGKIPAFNVWNEPDPSVIKYPELWLADAKAIHKAARSVDPDIKIVGLGMCANVGDPGHWHYPPLNPPISLGRYLDVYDWHPYPAPRNRRPEETNNVCDGVDNLKNAVPKIRALVAGKELWVSEFGYSICEPLDSTAVNIHGVLLTVEAAKSPMYPFDVTEKQQGDYLVRQVMLEFGYGIDKIFLYQIGPDGPIGGFEGGLGITRRRPNGLSAKLAYVQIANMVQELAGATPVGVEIPSSNIRVVCFRRGSMDVVAAWTVRKTAKLNFQVTDGYESDPFGNRNTRQGAITVKLTESPIFLVGKNVEYRPSTVGLSSAR